MTSDKRKRPARKVRRTSVLWLIALTLTASGALRLSGPVGAAVAAQSDDSTGSGVSRAELVLGVPLDDQTLPQILEMFRAREARLLEAEEKAAAREEALAQSAQSVAAQLEQLAAAEERLASTLAKTDEAASADLARLATLYENMKPQDAAALFSTMDPGFAAGFLGLMRPEPAAAIMTLLEPDTAHLISIMLAGRNAGGPRRE